MGLNIFRVSKHRSQSSEFIKLLGIWFSKPLVALGLSLTIVSCGTVAITGRSQLNLVSDSELISAANDNFAKFINTANSKNAVLNASESQQAANIVGSVQRVSSRIIAAAGLQGKYNWQITVVKSNALNAFVLPNGKIVVYTGIIPIAKSEAGLAAIIGHEVAHVTARHSAERMSQKLLAQATIDAVDTASAANNPKNRPIIAAALGLGAQYGVLLPFSREHESEADRIGQIYMAKAGYDPSEAIEVWVRMARSSGKSSAEFTSTHPAHETRQIQLKQWLPEAQMYFADRGRPLPTSISELQAARLESSQAGSLAPLGMQPELREGYWWKAKSLSNGNETNFTFEKLESCDFGTCITIRSSTSAKRIVTTDFKIVRQENSNGTWTKFSSPIRQIQFPIRVGDVWEDTVEVETSDGKKRTVVFKSQVASYESTVVPAGNFMAYKIISSAGGARFSEIWFSPEARGPVKTISLNSAGESTTVMTDYERSTDPTGTISSQ